MILLITRDNNNDSCGFPNSNNVTSCVAIHGNGVNNDISSGDTTIIVAVL